MRLSISVKRKCQLGRSRFTSLDLVRLALREEASLRSRMVHLCISKLAACQWESVQLV
jgi:hypothetical protein